MATPAVGPAVRITVAVPVGPVVADEDERLPNVVVNDTG